MLASTKAGDTKQWTELLEYAHNTHSPLTLYNNEAELASIYSLGIFEGFRFLSY